MSDRVEDWVVSTNGFWCKGEVNATRWCVPFTGTWEQVHARYMEMLALCNRQADELRELERRHQQERKQFWPDA